LQEVFEVPGYKALKCSKHPRVYHARASFFIYASYAMILYGLTALIVDNRQSIHYRTQEDEGSSVHRSSSEFRVIVDSGL